MPAQKSMRSRQVYAWEGYTGPGVLEEIAAFVSSVGVAWSLNDDVLFHLQMAIGEASANSWEHSYQKGKGRLRLELERHWGILEVRVTDWGRPFDLGKTPAPRLGPDLDRVDLEGLGIFLMRKMVDEMTYRSDARSGNVLTLKKRLPGKRD